MFRQTATNNRTDRQRIKISLEYIKELLTESCSACACGMQKENSKPIRQTELFFSAQKVVPIVLEEDELDR